jgi:hypothetical protein
MLDCRTLPTTAWILAMTALIPSARSPISSCDSTGMRAVRSPAPDAISRTRACSSEVVLTMLRVVSQPTTPPSTTVTTLSTIMTVIHAPVRRVTAASSSRICSRSRARVEWLACWCLSKAGASRSRSTWRAFARSAPPRVISGRYSSSATRNSSRAVPSTSDVSFRRSGPSGRDRPQRSSAWWKSRLRWLYSPVRLATSAPGLASSSR